MHQEFNFTGTAKRRKETWEDEIKGKGLTPAQQAYIDSLPKRDSSKCAQNDEAYCQAFERNADKVKGSKFEDNLWMKRNEFQRKGKLMHHMTFLRKLRAAGVRCWFNPQPVKGLVGLKALRKGYEQLGVQYICAVQLGWTTEFCLFNYDRYGLELNRRFVGWRSVLIQLIAKGIISEAQAHKIFGRPLLNEASLLYRRSLQQIRSDRGVA
jgi:hypothetical protein